MEWPPRSGKQQEFPEIDRADFFRLEEAIWRVNPAQMELLIRLKQLISSADT
jgi:predicted NUDIX family NTP pyrophosphohydrolase